MKTRNFNILILGFFLTFFGLFFFYSSPNNLLAQAACPTTNSSIRLRSGSLLTLVNTSLTKFSFNGTLPTPYCITSNPAYIDPISDRTYSNIKRQYYDDSKPVKFDKPTLTAGDKDQSSLELGTTAPVALSGRMYWVQGSLSINSNISPLYKTGVIFIDGNLNINTSLAPTPATKSAGLIFVVQGDVSISNSTSEINAVIVTNGTFCDTSPCTSYDGPLTINGSIISLSPDAAKKPLFKRVNGGNTSPAEIINYEPKYLPILRDIFAKTQDSWTEVK